MIKPSSITRYIMSSTSSVVSIIYKKSILIYLVRDTQAKKYEGQDWGDNSWCFPEISSVILSTWFMKDSCQLLVKVCAQVQVNCLETKPTLEKCE